MPRHRNLGQSWYPTVSAQGKRTSRWRYSKVVHVAENEESTEAYCGELLERAARAYSEQAFLDNGLDYYSNKRINICKKCQKHPSFGLLLLRVT